MLAKDRSMTSDQRPFQDDLIIYAGMLGFSLVVLTQILAKDRLDDPLFFAVVCFAVSIPLQAILVMYMVKPGKRVKNFKSLSILAVVSTIPFLLGTLGVFAHFSPWVAGVAGLTGLIAMALA